MSIATGAKLLDLADGLQSKIDEKRAPMTQNWTARRQRMKDAQNRDADTLEKTQRALRALGRAFTEDRVPEVLAKVKTKAAVELVLGFVYGPAEEIDKKWKRIGIDLVVGHDGRSAARKAMAELVGDTSDIDAAREDREKRSDQDASLRLSKRAGFFPTPPELAALVVDLANISANDVTLEPSSGLGDLAKLVPGPVVCVEIAADLADRTREACCDAKVVVGDFEDDDLDIEPPFDRVVMNPPFEKGAALRHVRRAFEMLAEGGRLVAVMPASADSQALAEELGGEWYDQGSAFAGASAFKSTSVRVGLLVVDRS